MPGRTSRSPIRSQVAFAAVALLGPALAVGVLAPSSAGESGYQGGGEPLQGQVPLADQQSGRSLRPYTANMELVGSSDISARGMNGNLAWLEDCGYVASYFGDEHPLAGLAVVDASNPRNPVHVATQPGTPGTRESQVEANATRRMVVVMPFSSATPFGDDPGPSQLQYYSAGPDCTQLTRRGTYDFGDVLPHEHRISTDGDTTYATVSRDGAPGDALQVVDSTDLDNPRLLTTWDYSHEPGGTDSTIHDLDVNAGGTRAYANIRYTGADGTTHNGLAILDTSQVQQRVSDPRIRLISLFDWPTDPSTAGISHSAQLANIGGRKYVIAQDEVFSTQRCPWGAARIIDVTNETRPVQVSKIALEVSRAEHCDTTLADNAMYSTHYLGVDSVRRTSMLFMTWYSSGLRAYDIRDPHHPREIGYYVSGARTDTLFTDDRADRYANNRVDYAYSFVRYRPKSGHIWFNSVFNGFQIVRLLDNPESR